MGVILFIIGVILIIIGIIGVLISPLLGTCIIIGGYMLCKRNNFSNSNNSGSIYANHYDGRNSDDNDCDDGGCDE